MPAQEDQLPPEGQPMQAQEPGGDDAAERAAANQPAQAAAEAAQTATTDAADAGAADVRAAPAGPGRRSRRPVASPAGTRRRGADGRYLRTWRGVDASLHELRAELSAMADDLGYLLRNESVVNPELKAQLEQRVVRLRGTVSLLAEEAIEAGERLRAEVQDELQARVGAARSAVRKQPITSVAMAAVLGVSVGMLLSRRR